MPTYEYRCSACAYTFDLFQSITERPIRKCLKCGKHKLERLFGTGSAILFKGSGFYQTDYRSSEYKSRLKSENDSVKSDAKGQEKK